MIFPGARLGKVDREAQVSSGGQSAPIIFATCCAARWQLLSGLPAVQDRDERRNRLPLDLVRSADDGGLRHRRDDRRGALDFHRADAMAGDVHDVIDTPSNQK